MKNFYSKLTALLLCLLMVVPLLAACADDKDQTIVDPNKNTEDGKNTPTFVDADFDGDTFTILSAQDEAQDFIDHYIDNEEINGEPINDAVVERNRLVEEKYNVTVERMPKGVSYAAQAAKSGTVDFEIVYDWGFRLVPSATEGLFYDLLQVPNTDLTQSYWAPSAHDDLTIADKMLIFTNDISMNRIGWAYFLYFNKRIIEDLNLELPYTYVENNTWTFDQYLDMVISAEQDNGDTLWTKDDQYGSLGSSQGTLGSFREWAGITGTKKNEDGTYTLDVYNEKLTTLFADYNKKLSTTSAFAGDHDIDWKEGADISAWESPFKADRFLSFGEGHILFASFSMDMTHEFVNMEDDYGVVPNPKYTPAQEEYYHYIDTCAPMFAIIKQADDLDMVGILLEYMAYESEQKLLPAFYEQTIKTKRMKDLEGRDEKMLDIIRDSARYSWTSLYWYGIKNAEGDPWDPCGKIFSEMLASGNIVSVYKMYKNSAEKSINDIYDLILAMDVNK